MVLIKLKEAFGFRLIRFTKRDHFSNDVVIRIN